MKQIKKKIHRTAISLLLGLLVVSTAPQDAFGKKAKDLVIIFDASTGSLTGSLTESSTDYLTGSLTGRKASNEVDRFIVAKGKNVIFYVTNINLLSYKVGIQGKTVSHNYNTNTPSQYEATKQEKTQEEAQETKTGDQVLDPIQQLDDAINELKKIKNFQSLLERQLLTTNNLEHLKMIQKKLSLQFIHGADYKEKLLKNELKIDDVLKETKQLQTAAKNTLEVIKGEIKSYGDSGKRLLNDLDELNELYKQEEKKKKEIKEKLEQIKSENYQNIFKRYAKTGDFWLQLSEKLYQLTQLLKEFKDTNYPAKIKNTFDQTVPSNFSASLTVPTVSGDEVQFTVTIEPIGKNKTPAKHQLEKPVVVKIKGGWLHDFSMGVLFQFDAHDRSYRFDPVPGNSNGNANSTEVILKRDERKHSVTPVMGALMHIYPRQVGKVKWTITFGAGIGEAEKLSYYLGLGTILGSKRRFIISAGIALVKHNRLLSEYKDYLDKPDKPMVLYNDLKPEDVVRSTYLPLHFFLSLTYNL